MTEQQKKPRIRQSFIHGASILMGAMIVCKFLGAVFKLPLTSLIGSAGNGYFNTAYMIFTPFYSFSVSGLTSAVARLVAEQSAHGRWNDIRLLKRISKRVFFLLASLSFVIIIAFAWIFVNYISPNPNALLSVYAIAPAALFGIITASYRGYYEGMRNMTPTAVSQIVENIVKIAFGLGFVYVVYKIGEGQYAATGKVFGVVAGDDFDGAVTPFAAAAAVLGVSLSSFSSFLYLWARDRFKGDGITRQELAAAPAPMSARTILIRLIKVAIPISIGSLVLNFTSLVDFTTVINRLLSCFKNNPGQMMEIFGGNLKKGLSLDDPKEITNYIFGAYTGMSMLVATLVPDFISVLGKSSLPNVAAAWIVRDKAGVKYNIESLVRISSLMAIPAGIGISVLAGPILSLLFSSRPLEVAIATPLLSLMAINGIFISIVTPVFNVFQAIGRSNMPIRFMCFGAVIKLTSNFILVGIPSINIHGAPIGTMLCYIFIFFMCFYSLPRITGIKIDYTGTLIKPLISGLVCGAAAYAGYYLVPGKLMVKTVAAITAGIIFYVIMLALLRVLSREDIISLPKGKNIIKTLEKFKIIG